MKRKRKFASKDVVPYGFHPPYTFNELLNLVPRWTGRSVGDRALRYWFEWLNVQVQFEYDWFDCMKILRFGLHLNRIRNYEFAARQVIKDLDECPGLFVQPTKEEKPTHIDVGAKAA